MFSFLLFTYTAGVRLLLFVLVDLVIIKNTLKKYLVMKCDFLMRYKYHQYVPPTSFWELSSFLSVEIYVVSIRRYFIIRVYFSDSLFLKNVSVPFYSMALEKVYIIYYVTPPCKDRRHHVPL